MKVFKD